jgi:hypothetical protein
MSELLELAGLGLGLYCLRHQGGVAYALTFTCGVEHMEFQRVQIFTYSRGLEIISIYNTQNAVLDFPIYSLQASWQAKETYSHPNCDFL